MQFSPQLCPDEVELAHFVSVAWFSLWHIPNVQNDQIYFLGIAESSSFLSVFLTETTRKTITPVAFFYKKKKKKN